MLPDVRAIKPAFWWLGAQNGGKVGIDKQIRVLRYHKRFDFDPQLLEEKNFPPHPQQHSTNIVIKSNNDEMQAVIYRLHSRILIINAARR